MSYALSSAAPFYPTGLCITTTQPAENKEDTLTPLRNFVKKYYKKSYLQKLLVFYTEYCYYTNLILFL
jgi:hypothetical protein